MRDENVRERRLPRPRRPPDEDVHGPDEVQADRSAILVDAARLVRHPCRVGAGLLRRGRRQAMRALRHVAKQPARAVRCAIAGVLIAGLIALGATRERPGAATSRGDVTVLLITSHDGKARHRTRLRCRATGIEPVEVYVRRGRHARCTPPRGGRAVDRG
jgi:hypothetical protein